MGRPPRGAIGLAAVVIAVVAGCGPPARTVSGTAIRGVSHSDAVRDGDLEFTVLGASRARQVGDLADPGRSITAHGVFISVSLSIRNVGDRPITFVDAHQQLVDTRGDVFPVSRAADIYANPGVPSTRMAPGDELQVRLAFDVPTGTEPDAIVLRASELSRGATVPLR